MKVFLLFFLGVFSMEIKKTNGIQKDEFQTSSGKFSVYFLGHASLFFTYNDQVIYVDPCSQYGDYSSLPKATLILITHHHFDHFDTAAIAKVITPSTQIIVNQTVYNQWRKGTVMKNGEKKVFNGIEIEAVPAYNLTRGREQFHPRGGRDNGYVITLGGRRIYIAGDTENIPEMSGLGKIYIAFLPMNQPYTMLPEQVAEAARRIKPEILYPYHYGDTDPQALVRLLKNEPSIEVRIRNLR